MGGPDMSGGDKTVIQTGVANIAERYALVICDAQPDFISAIPEDVRKPFMDTLKEVLGGARSSNWFVAFTGLRFPSGYEGVNERHRLYGGLKRLNAKAGDAAVHYFMEGYTGSDITPELKRQEGDAVIWRQQHLATAELVDTLRGRGITKVVVAGVKTSHAVQATCQALCDDGLLIYVVKEAVADDVKERNAAILEHILPVYADVVAWEEFREGIAQEMLMDRYVEVQSTKPAEVDTPEVVDPGAGGMWVP